MARKKKQFGSPKAVHTEMANRAAKAIEEAAQRTSARARVGRCTAATMAYADMQQAIGEYKAHTRSGGSAWENITVIRQAAGDYTDRCVRDDGAGLGRTRKARR